MKKIYLLFVAVTLAACSAEPLENEVLTNLDANLEGKSNNKAAVHVTEEFIIPSSICAGQDADFLINAPIGSNIQIQQLSGGDWIQVDHVSQSTSNPHKTTLNFETAGEYQLRYKAGSGGFSDAYLIIVNKCGCEESFNYVDNGDSTYSFTYVPAEDLIEAVVVFTFAQGVDVEGLTGWDANGQTRQKIMDFEACTPYNWVVELQANCSGKSGSSNVWTDFKVNDLSKKADEEDKFIQSCN